MRFSNGRINAFYTANEHERESIRQDVLLERYADLQLEMENIENLLNISEQEKDETLFDINDMLFNIIESLVPELVVDDEDDNKIEDIKEDSDDMEDRKKIRAMRIKNRERQSITIAKNAEKLSRAKSNIKTARLGLRGAQKPETKAKARERLRTARKHLATTGIKAGTAKQ